MSKKTNNDRHFPNALEDCIRSKDVPDTQQTRSPAYKLAFDDQDFMLSEEMRSVRIQLELQKPELIMQERGIESTIAIFGGARIPAPGKKVTGKPAKIAKALEDKSSWYQVAEDFAKLASKEAMRTYGKEYVVVSGGGPGIMEAANKGAQELGAPSIGLNIVLPHEQAPNEFVTPELCFNFHYFAIRKMHFLIRAKALAAFPGGFGTLDELFETLTLIQTTKIKPMPVLLFNEEFWRDIVNWEKLADHGTISQEDLDLFHFVETAEQGWKIVQDFHGI